MLFQSLEGNCIAPLFAQKQNTINFLPGIPTAEKQIEKEPFSILAHEVRNPLSAISLSLEMLEPILTNADQKFYVDIIRRSYLRIDSLINLLLKSGMGEKTVKKEESIHLLLDDVIEIAADRIALKNISVLKNYTANDFNIKMNEPKMKIALTNIIVNAIDAMPFGTGVLQIITKVTAGKFQVYINDNGCGIKKEHLKNIFEPYFTTKPNGVGIGLALSHNIFISNGVQVNVESEEGSGTCFTLSFDNFSLNHPLS